jgi:hypothetical protein
MVDLPAPIMPTSTTERVPSADVMSASWEVLVVAGKAYSGIKKLCRRKLVTFHATYTTPADTVARDSCNRQGNMLEVRRAYPDDSMVNSPPEAR